MKKKPYIIGTRGSLLALTQCLQMKNIMEEKGLGKFELKIISTQGDENTQAPLWQLEGKDFFTKELDAALLQGEVDLVVHSYKDLGSERPEGIELATVTERYYAHDILFIKNETIAKLQNKEMESFVVGTSSPRRMTNITQYLKQYLPYGVEKNIDISCKSLRGNVNTRLEKLLNDDYDAIVLALPGIERLAMGLPDHDNEAFEKHGDPRAILSELLKDLNFMILPLSEFPAAASQGALGIECLSHREDNKELLTKLQSLNCQQTKKEVAYEREVFQSFGGGCHLAVGISARWNKQAEKVRMNIRGQVDEQVIDRHELKGRELPPLKKTEKVFLGIGKSISIDDKRSTIRDEITEKKPTLKNILAEIEDEHVFMTSGSALDYATEVPEHKKLLKESYLWSSGIHTMKKMAAAGLWVQGSADSLGEEEVQNLAQSHLVQLKCGKRSWKVLTNDSSQSILGPTLGVYTKEFKEANDSYQSTIESCDIYYWTSYPQYKYFQEHFNLNQSAYHCCGLGKTLKNLQEENLDRLISFSSMKEFQDWIK